MTRVHAEPGNGVEAPEEAPAADAGPPEDDDSLDPRLLELFREARNEAQERALASELPDIPIQDLLDDLVSVGRGLGIKRLPDTAPAAVSDSAPPPASRRAAVALPPSAGYRRYALHGLLLGLTLAVAIASGLTGAERIATGKARQDATPAATATATVPGVVVVRHDRQADSAGQPSSNPTPGLQPAYVAYTVQPEDTVFSIAAAVGINLDSVTWSNPSVISDPNLLVTGDKLLIPSVAGIIYRVQPDDTITVLGRLAPERPEDAGLSPSQPQSP